jgi:glycosyltransferase involved in cell wall biosynthesis
VISVIVTTFNCAAYLGAAIESVISQTLAADEIIVVDDGSSDGSAELVRQYGSRVLYLWQSNQGPGAARSLGIRVARGELLGFLDSDDLWLPCKLELQKAALDEDPALDLVFGKTVQFRDSDPDTTGSVDERAQPSPLISCLLARRTAFDRVGLLRTDLRAEFVEWYLRAQEAGLRMRTLDELIVKRRVHEGNFTKRHDLRRDYLLSLKASLDRRRGKAITPNSGATT